MEETLQKFELLLNRFDVLYSTNSIDDFEFKITPNRWSKKEILGHLIDSAINNIQRFTEIHTFEKPYIIRAYNPDDLVKSNDYQNKNNQELLELWIRLNHHVIHLLKNQTDETLNYQLILPNGATANLKFLIEDYFAHLYHHLHQINPEWT